MSFAPLQPSVGAANLAKGSKPRAGGVQITANFCTFGLFRPNQ